MGHKKVCIDYKLTSNRDFNSGTDLTYPCPECQKSMMLLPHRFRPPKKTDIKGWQLVKLLTDNGFYFQHIYQEGSGELFGKLTDNYVSYSKNLREAKEFVITHKNNAIK